MRHRLGTIHPWVWSQGVITVTFEPANVENLSASNIELVSRNCPALRGFPYLDNPLLCILTPFARIIL